MKECTRQGCAVKVLGNGRAKILTPAEIDRVFDRGFITARDRLLFAVTFYCACRISEALAFWGGDKEVYEIDCIRVAARIPC